MKPRTDLTRSSALIERVRMLAEMHHVCKTFHCLNKSIIFNTWKLWWLSSILASSHGLNKNLLTYMCKTMNLLKHRTWGGQDRNQIQMTDKEKSVVQSVPNRMDMVDHLLTKIQGSLVRSLLISSRRKPSISEVELSAAL